MRLARAALLLTIFAVVVCGGAYARPAIPLDGVWEYTYCDATAPPGSEATWAPITVPAVMEWRPEGPHTVWFRRPCYVPSSWSGNRAILRLNGVKYSHKVFLNGKAVGGVVGGFSPAEYDVTRHLIPGATNALALQVQDWTALLPANAKLETAQPPKGTLLLPVGGTTTQVGLWDSVSLELRPRVWIDDVCVTTSVRDAVMLVDVRVKNGGEDDRRTKVTARISAGGGGPFFAPEEIVVPAGATETVTLMADWPNPKLWSPQTPHLYTLVVGLRTGAMADAVQVRFGFREFWAEGNRFYLNCLPLHLLAVSAPQVICDQSSDRFFGTIRDAGANAVRLGGQPWPQRWYEAADEAGVLVIAESALCDMAEYYALQDQKFWNNARRDLCAMVASLRSHPSIVLWSVERELLASGGAAAKQGEQQVGEWVEAIQALDPTRPVMCGGDADGGGAADVYSLRRPHELPRWNQWPETASWLGGPVQLDGYPCGSWQWSQDKPLYLDEFLRLPLTDVAAATVLFGDAAFPNPDLSRTLAETQAREWQVIAARDVGVSAISAWTVDEIADPASPARQAMSRAYRPLAAFDLSANTHVFAGKVVARAITVVNDTDAARRLDLRWRLVPSVGKWKVEGGYPVTLPPAGRERVNAVLALPPVDQERVKATFTVDLCETGRVVFSASTEWEVFGNGPLSGRIAGAPKRVAVYDPKGDTTRLLAEMGIASLPFDHTRVRQALRDCPVAVIGTSALLFAPGVPTGPMMAELLTHVRGGGTLLVFEQPRYPSALMPTQLTTQSATITFARDAAHPALQGLTEQDLAHWLPNGLVSLMEMQKPTWGGFRTIADSGGACGLATAGLAEVRLGKGRIILNQLDLTTKYGVDPVATRIARNLLAYVGTKPAPTGRIGVILDAPAPMHLNLLGVEYDRYTDRLARLFQGAHPALLIAAPNRVQPYAESLRRYVQRGGRVIFHNVTPAAMPVVAELAGVPIRISDNAGGPITLTNRTGPAAGMSNAEFNWLQADPQTSALCFSPAVASYLVDLSSVKQAVVHTTPGVLASIPYGKGLWIIDQVRWDAPGPHQVQAQRYLATLLLNVGAAFGEPAIVLQRGSIGR